MLHLDIWLLLGATLVLSAIVAVRLSHKAGLPTLLAYMGLGLFIGESGPLHIYFDNAELAETLGLAAGFRAAFDASAGIALTGALLAGVLLAVPARFPERSSSGAEGAGLAGFSGGTGGSSPHK